MWEERKVYRRLDNAEINPTFRKFGAMLLSLVEGFRLDQTASTVKLSRDRNQLEQAIFIEKQRGSFDLKVRTSIKPVDFYRSHKFTMINVVDLGDILNNHRRTSFPLTQEWEDLAVYLAARIKSEVESYFTSYDSYEKILANRKKIEQKNAGLDNRYELLIYAAIRTMNRDLLISYLDKKLERPVMGITQSEFLKPASREIDEMSFLRKIKDYASSGDFSSIEREIAQVSKQISS